MIISNESLVIKRIAEKLFTYTIIKWYAVNIYHSQLWPSKCIVGEICQEQTSIQEAKLRAWVLATERTLPGSHL